MAAQVIPLAPGTPFYRQRTVLEGREYVLRLRWSQLESRWYLDVYDAQENLLAGAIKVVVNWPLLEACRFSQALPPGELVAFDGRPDPRDPGLDELGASIPLLYWPAADAAAGAA
jgi:hypothetical protein